MNLYIFACKGKFLQVVSHTITSAIASLTECAVGAYYENMVHLFHIADFPVDDHQNEIDYETQSFS